jgi:hypothetical protein
MGLFEPTGYTLAPDFKAQINCLLPSARYPQIGLAELTEGIPAS